jgi:hypothetical protein
MQERVSATGKERFQLSFEEKKANINERALEAGKSHSLEKTTLNKEFSRVQAWI